MRLTKKKLKKMRLYVRYAWMILKIAHFICLIVFIVYVKNALILYLESIKKHFKILNVPCAKKELIIYILFKKQIINKL